MSELEITWAEYHPVGNELTVTRCRAVATGPEQSPVLIGDGVAVPISRTEVESRESELIGVHPPISASANSEVLVFGSAYVATLRSLHRMHDDPTVIAVTHLPQKAFNTRIFVQPKEGCDFLLAKLVATFQRALDSECEAGRAESPFVDLLLEILSSHPGYETRRRVASALYVYVDRRDEEATEKVLIDAELFDGITRREAMGLAAAYKASLSPKSRLAAFNNDMLALNAKFDLLTAQVDKVNSDVRAIATRSYTPASILFMSKTEMTFRIFSDSRKRALFPRISRDLGSTRPALEIRSDAMPVAIDTEMP